MTGALTVEGLHAGYGHVPVLVDIDLHVAGGEVVGLLGANGAGKTTLLRALSGTIPLASGSLDLDGSLTRAKPWNRVRRGLVHVQEGRHVFTAMTVEDNLSVAALVAPSDRERNLEHVHSLFPRLAERRRQLAGSMSGGEQQMLAIGRALMCSPRVLLVDEMSAGLAPVLAQQLVEALVRISQQGVGVLVVEQTPHLIADAVERVYLLEGGRVAAEGAFGQLGGADGVADLYLGVSERLATTNM